MLATDWVVQINKNTIQDMGFTLIFALVYLYSVYAGTIKDPTQELLFEIYKKADTIDSKLDILIKNSK